MTAVEFCAALDRLNFSRRELAINLGVADSTVNRWARGELPVPQYVVYVLLLLQTINNLTDDVSQC